jgi:lipopolysaccharide/colanic/teichoic acid biosynthesis glycosyltransferase
MAIDIFQRRGLGYRLRFQIFGIICCAVLPYAVRFIFYFGDQSEKILLFSLVASIIASIIGLFLVRNVNIYPGVEGSSHIIPSFMLSFGVVVSVFFLGRIEYSRYLFVLTFFLDVIFLYATYFIAQRRIGITVGMVPGGEIGQLDDIKRIQWVPLHTPDSDISRLSAVVADLRTDLSDEWERRLADYALSGLPVYHSKHLRESLTGRVELEHLSENSFGTLSPVSAYMTIKHALDWLAALAAMIVLMPLFVILCIVIRLDSAGSPIFRQRRIGYSGQPFVVWKFRTMTKREEAAGNDLRRAAMTTSGDQRITRIGRFLRTSRLDELPQIVNVLKREMSWIGPRPEAEVLSQWYEAEIPFYRYRHIVRPGITGWAQVSQGHVADVADVRAKLHYDFYYIKNFSPWIDLLICARTVRTMLTGFGAR